jgi:hypothetical protein
MKMKSYHLRIPVRWPCSVLAIVRRTRIPVALARRLRSALHGESHPGCDNQSSGPARGDIPFPGQKRHPPGASQPVRSANSQTRGTIVSWATRPPDVVCPGNHTSIRPTNRDAPMSTSIHALRAPTRGVAGVELRAGLTGRKGCWAGFPGLHPGLVELALQAGIAGGVL